MAEIQWLEEGVAQAPRDLWKALLPHLPSHLADHVRDNLSDARYEIMLVHAIGVAEKAAIDRAIARPDLILTHRLDPILDAEFVREVKDRLNRVARWRTVFASMQLGTRADDDPECNAVKATNELLILLRVEVSALTGVLLRSGVITDTAWHSALREEARELDSDYARRFPGFQSTKGGLAIVDPAAAADTSRGWPA